MSATKILLLTPYFKENRGNSTTAKRISAGLQQNGMKVSVFAYEEEAWNEDIQTIADECDVIHVIHFYRFAKWLKKTSFQLNRPYIMTNGGTDVNLNLGNQVSRTEMQLLIKRANAITVFTTDAKEKIKSAYHHLNLKVEVIPQSVWLPPADKVRTQDQWLNIAEGKPAILLPAGLRQVKDVFFLMKELIFLQKKYSALQFVICGMVLEKKIYETLQLYMKKYNWIHFLENVPIEKMVSLYQWAHIVLNTSISEGQSSALLEAMSMGCVVFARNNPGNSSIVQDGNNGYLFNDGDEFLKKMELVLNNEDQVVEILQRARNYVQFNHGFEDEIGAFIRVYEKCVE